MTNLSPAAQAVLDAVVDGALPPFHVIARPMAAAALRAAADQLIDPTSAHTLYAIADELENFDD
jgi:hypothetical protein